MPVTESCTTNSLAVLVQLSAGQRLRYTISGGAGATFTLRTEVPTTLLSNAGAERVHEWPQSAAHGPTANPATHTLGMVFGQSDTLDFTIELIDAAGGLISVVKNCSYAFDGTPQPSFFTALDIFHS